jgi:hypothetical protein
MLYRVINLVPQNRLYNFKQETDNVTEDELQIHNVDSKAGHL